VDQVVVESRSPQWPEDIVAQVGSADAAEIEAAFLSARAVGGRWASAPALERSAVLGALASSLEADAEGLRDLIVREIGKPVSEAAGEVARGVAILRYYSQQVLDPDGETYPPADGRALTYTRRRPRGAVALITPWNFPVAIPIWKLAPALAFGNAVVLKPAPESIGVALRLAELAKRCLPDGLVQVLIGDAEVGQAVVAAADAVSFTGSCEAGNSVAITAASRGIPYQCEMGGLNASIILPDADLEFAASTIAGAAMGFAGQKCTATSRVIVAGAPEAFTDAFVAAVKALSVGDPANPGNPVGPVISETARREALDAIAESTRSAARVLLGGQFPVKDGWYVEPTVVNDPDCRSTISWKEVFAPVCALNVASDMDQLVALNNAVPYGLVTSVFTQDLNRVMELVQRLDTGMVRINGSTTGVDFYVPFGGEKASSAGPREQGKAAKELYTTVQTVSIWPNMA
jgi:alpha-ketoglutaric semialdehyde dehydrogenase